MKTRFLLTTAVAALIAGHLSSAAEAAGKTLRFAGSAQSPALGSAMHAAVAAGIYPNIQAAAEKMGKLQDRVVHPIPENQVIYDRLYAEYKLLYDYFGRGPNDVMKRLKAIKYEVRAG